MNNNRIVNLYVEKLIASCETSKNWIVFIKKSRKDEIFNKIKLKCKVVSNIGNVVVKYKYKDVDLATYKQGKILILHVDEINNFLEELFS